MRRVQLGVGALCVLLGCASHPAALEGFPPAISSHQDPAADVSAYRTYAYLQPLDTDEADGTRSRLSTLLIEAVDRELAARGFRRADDPDLLVNFDLQTAQRQAAAPPGPPARYRRARYRQWRGHEPAALEYTEGTLSIDLIDARSNAVVWEGLAQGPMQGEPEQVTPERVRDVVSLIFEHLPDAGEP